MKNLENLTGVKTLNKRVQQNIKGGKMQCNADGTCPPWVFVSREFVNFTCQNFNLKNQSNEKFRKLNRNQNSE